MNDGDVSPPTDWFEAAECPRDDCDEERFVPEAMDLHLVRDHEPRSPRSVPDRIGGGAR